MQDSRPLSTLFDPCQPSVMLRAVLGVQTALAIVVMFETPAFDAWFLQYAVLTIGTLPATLLWLMLCCIGLRHLPTRARSPEFDLGLAVLLGMLCGVLGCALLDGLSLITHPPWLASALAAGLLAGVLMGLLIWRAKALQPSESQARLVELQARIRPHFLFNTLNSAIALVRQEPAKAETLLEDLSELFRAALEQDERPSTLAHELALAQRYLAIEQVRFGERLRVHWQLDSTVSATKLPALILQPLVENAVRHGVEPSASGADIHIHTQLRHARVLITITNTMPQGAGSAGHGLALPNVGERLALMHDLEADFRYGTDAGQFTVRIEVPV